METRSGWKDLLQRANINCSPDLLQLGVAILGASTQLLLDTDQLVVLSHTVGAAHATSLNLARVSSHGDISDSGILCLARAVRGNGGIAMTVSHLDSVEGLGQRTNLVHLDKAS